LLFFYPTPGRNYNLELAGSPTHCTWNWDTPHPWG